MNILQIRRLPYVKRKKIEGVVALIGVVMIAMHYEAGLTAASVLSGVAFLLFGGSQCMKG